MITLASLLREHQEELVKHYGSRLQPRHYKAIHDIMGCHTENCGEMAYYCDPCAKQDRFYHSCGHRSCPACQHNVNNQWLDRQRQKLLPVDYYMVTFTLPFQLRSFVWNHQKWAYQALFQAAMETLSEFGINDKKLAVELAMTGILHTHSRRMDFHPHVHFVVPNGGLAKDKTHWKKKSGKYLFNGKALARVFKGKFQSAMRKQGHRLPDATPKDWIAQCQHVGKGESALVYLARYLYRGVINEKNIISHEQGNVTFRYQESESKQWKKRTEPAVHFLWLIIQHILPKGFRRARDYGFLHGNAKRTLKRLQLMLHVSIPVIYVKPKRPHPCTCCGEEMQFIPFFKSRRRFRMKTTN